MAAQTQQTQQPSSSAPKTRLGLSLSERIKVIEARQMGKSMRQLAAQFGCGKTQILNTLAQKERYIREWEVMGRNNPSIGARKRFRHTRNEQINRSVHEWYQQQAASGLRITGPMLQKQARHYAAHLGIMNFAASNGWLANFRRFYNIISCSPHPRKRKPPVPLPENGTSEADPQASTSNCRTDAEFVQVGYDEAIKRSPRVSSEESIEKDPLQDSNQQMEILCISNIKSEPASDDSDSDHYSSSQQYLDDASLTISSQVFDENQKSSGRMEGGVSTKPHNNHVNQAPTVNLRKRRLLQLERLDHSSSAEVGGNRINSELANTVEERRLPDLTPIFPLKVCSTELLNLARAKGLLTAIIRDDCGNDWIEIRNSIAFYRVPSHGYPTHLSRLVVDSSLTYYLEVLGQCVQKGSLIFKGVTCSFNYPEAASILDALVGGNTVCDGIESLTHRVADLHNIRTIQQVANAENMYPTFPDNRFRSTDCSIWIDATRIGSKCLACKMATSNFHSTPMDLRCPPAHLHHEH